MSVRATNVYEERSLGLFNEEEDDSDEESAFGKGDPSENKMVGWSRYLAFHARRQLAFDIWWLGLALWLVCIIERSAINDKENESYFTIFQIIFELVSAYGTVGLSLGTASVRRLSSHNLILGPTDDGFDSFFLSGQLLVRWSLHTAGKAHRHLRYDSRPAPRTAGRHRPSCE